MEEMMPKHRVFCASLLLAAMMTSAFVHAQSWPTRPIRLVVPFAPGGNTDIIARAIAPKMTQELGQQILIDNRGGAGSTLPSSPSHRRTATP
jgi:tripartite-type tricarboxylate transporter receptor subunit TctC